MTRKNSGPYIGYVAQSSRFVCPSARSSTKTTQKQRHGQNLSFPKHPQLPGTMANVVAEIGRINQAELDNGTVGTAASWHAKYQNCAWVFAGNLPIQLTEGDVICVLSQFGEIEDINLVRDEETGKSRGFAFVKYEDSRSGILAVDNLTGSSILGRKLRVDHVENYRLPKHLLEKEEEEKNGDGKDGSANPLGPGRMYKDKELANEYNIHQGQDLFAPPPPQKPNDSKKTKKTKKHDDEETEHRRKQRRAEKEKARAAKAEKKEAKQKRKEERQEKRKARELRRQDREERRRGKKRSRKGKEKTDRYDDDDDDDDDSDR